MKSDPAPTDPKPADAGGMLPGTKAEAAAEGGPKATSGICGGSTGADIRLTGLTARTLTGLGARARTGLTALITTCGVIGVMATGVMATGVMATEAGATATGK